MIQTEALDQETITKINTAVDNCLAKDGGKVFDDLEDSRKFYLMWHRIGKFAAVAATCFAVYACTHQPQTILHAEHGNDNKQLIFILWLLFTPLALALAANLYKRKAQRTIMPLLVGLFGNLRYDACSPAGVRDYLKESFLFSGWADMRFRNTISGNIQSTSVLIAEALPAGRDNHSGAPLSADGLKKILGYVGLQIILIVFCVLALLKKSDPNFGSFFTTFGLVGIFLLFPTSIIWGIRRLILTSGATFQGVIMCLKLNKPADAALILKNNGGKYFRYMVPPDTIWKEIKLPSSAFEKMFMAYSNDQVLGRTLLSPNVAEELIKLGRLFHQYPLNVSLIGQNLILALEGKSQFDVGSIYISAYKLDMVRDTARQLYMISELIQTITDEWHLKTQASS